MPGLEEGEYRSLSFQSTYAQSTISGAEAWGIVDIVRHGGTQGGAWKAEPPIKTWDDLERLKAPAHIIDEEATKKRLDLLREAIGDLLEIDVQRGPLLSGFLNDISTTLGDLRGIEHFMIDMYESPDRLHELLAFMRDGIMQNQKQAEDLEDPKPNSVPRKRKETRGFMAAQEFTLVSPEFHDEFLLRYQLPIIGNYGLSHYGCCEDLSRKIDLLRKFPNLRSIAITPSADVAKCADWNEDRIQGLLRQGLAACAGKRFHICVKDIETLQGEPDRLKLWIGIVRSALKN